MMEENALPSVPDSTVPAPIVSVVISCYNYGRYLNEAIESVLASTLQDIEIIVVNDGSTDPYTIEVLTTLEKPRTRVIHQTNKGASAARNHGIHHAKSKYIFTLDADDKIAPTMLEKCVAVLESKPQIGFVGSWAKRFGNTSFIWKFPPYHFYRLLFRNMISSGAMFRKKAWEQVGGFNEKMRYAEDWDFWIALSKKGWRGHVIPEPLWHYRSHANSKSKDPRRNRLAVLRQLRRNHAALYERRMLLKLRRIWGSGGITIRQMRLPSAPKKRSAVGKEKQKGKFHSLRKRRRLRKRLTHRN
jgi:glycosyltransferase involved in cell wall biosynthesis